MNQRAAGLIKALGEEKMAVQAPLGRLGDTEDLKGLALLYASDAGTSRASGSPLTEAPAW